MNKEIRKQLIRIKRVLKKYLPRQLRTKKAAGTALAVAAVLAIAAVTCWGSLAALENQETGSTEARSGEQAGQENSARSEYEQSKDGSAGTEREQGLEDDAWTEREQSKKDAASMKIGQNPGETTGNGESGEDAASIKSEQAQAASSGVQRRLSSREELLKRLVEEMPQKAAQYVVSDPEQPQSADTGTSAAKAEKETEDLWESGIVISYFTAPYPSNSGSEYNAKKAADYLNGAVIPKHSSFSYNKRIGERTKERGFVEAPVILRNKMVPGLGGGICEISSMLYNLCLQSGLPVTERSPHSLQVPYVPGGLDAAVSWGSIDFCFENPYDVPVVLLAGYDDKEKMFLVAAVAPNGAKLLGGTRYVPVSEKIGELTYEARVEVWQGTVQTGIQKLGTSHYAGVDDAE